MHHVPESSDWRRAEPTEPGHVPAFDECQPPSFATSASIGMSPLVGGPPQPVPDAFAEEFVVPDFVPDDWQNTTPGAGTTH